MLLSRKLGVGIAIVAIAVMLHPVAAQAYQPNPYSPAAVCGVGYTTVDSADAVESDGMGGENRVGAVYLLRYFNTGWFCAVTIKNHLVGVASDTGISLNALSSQQPHWYYAGPLKVYIGPGQCANANGYVTGTSGQRVYQRRDPMFPVFFCRPA